MSSTASLILFIGRSFPGSQHDFAWFKDHFGSLSKGFQRRKVHVDLGYQGIQKLLGSLVSIPEKRSKHQGLTAEQLGSNQQKSRIRVAVERAIAGLKNYRILQERLRLKKTQKVDEIFSLCAGLWNFKMTQRKIAGV